MKLLLPRGVKQKVLVLSSVIHGAKKEVDAIVFGLLAVHPQGDMPHPAYEYKTKTTAYKITHIPSGRKVVTLYGFQYTKQAAQLLSVGFDWSFRSIEELSAEDTDDLVAVLNTLRYPCFCSPRTLRKAREKEALELVEAGVGAKLREAQGVLPFNG